MITCWNARQAAPAMIVQHVGQWPVIEPTKPASAFGGYGDTIPFAGDMLAMNPRYAKRWTAAGVTDDRRKDGYW